MEQTDQIIFNILIDRSVISSLSSHCFGDKNAPVYGLISGKIFSEENSAHISGFVPCERNIEGLLEEKLSISESAKQEALNKIQLSDCIGSYCSDFSDIATITDQLFIPNVSNVKYSILLRIFVNKSTGSSSNEHGNFLSSISAFVINFGNFSSSYKTVLSFRDSVFIPKMFFESNIEAIKLFWKENKEYFSKLSSNCNEHDSDLYKLYCEYEKYLVETVEQELVYIYHSIESECRKISALKLKLKRIFEQKNLLQPTDESKEKLYSLLEQQLNSDQFNIINWNDFWEEQKDKSKSKSQQPQINPFTNGKKFDLKSLPPEIAAVLPSLVEELKNGRKSSV